MKKNGLFAVLFVAMFSVGFAGGPKASATELLVEYKDDARMSFSSEMNERVEGKESISSGVELWSLTDQADVEALRLELQKNPGVLHVEENIERELAAEVEDPGFQYQWWLPHIRPEGMWSRVSDQKKKVSVAVIDSGVDIGHADLEKRIRAGGYNFYDKTIDVSDESSHGTKVAGIIAAEYGNGIGGTGVAGPYDVKILPLKVFGNGNKTKTSIIVAAIDYAVSQKVDVINLSLGGDIASDIENEAIQRAIAEGISVVAAAGNKAEEGNKPFYPASYDDVISVGAVDSLNRHVKTSNYNDKLTLVAPGESIYTTIPLNGSGTGEGTSFSSPIVAGAIAMYKSLRPETSPQAMEKLLRASAMPLGNDGNSIYFGSGLLYLKALENTLPAKVVPVDRVEINTDVVTMDLSSGIVSNVGSMVFSTKKNQLARYIAYEKEPNNTFSAATPFPIYEIGFLRGAIDETSKDTDFYTFTTYEPGVLKLETYWLEGDSPDGYENSLIELDVYDEKQNPIGKSEFKEGVDGLRVVALQTELQQGTYYIRVSQASSYNEMFVRDEYEIASNFTPETIDEEIPSIVIGSVTMKTGEREFFLDENDDLREWSSSDPEVADVRDGGIVVAKRPGVAMLTFYMQNVEKILYVTVEDAVEPTFALSAKVIPAEADDRRIFWTSSDPSIVEVDQNGLITAKKVGTAFVTARASNGVAEIATIHVVRNGEGYKFASDFTDPYAPMDKVFRVTFTQPLSPFKDYSRDIVISRESDGAKRVRGFTAKVNPLNYKQLLIEPNTYWEVGYHYLTVTKNVQNTHLQPLAKESRFMFYAYKK